MSKRDDTLDLPTVSRPRLPAPQKPGVVLQTDNGTVNLTETQVTEVIKGGVALAGDVAAIGKGIVDIVKIRETAAAEVSKIDAKTRQVTAILQKHIEAMQEDHEQLKTRGNIVIQLVAQITHYLTTAPGLEPATRQHAIGMVPQMAEVAFKNRAIVPAPPRGPGS